MSRALPADVAVRRVRDDDWPRVRALRLDALRDPVAKVAFLETVDQALARPEKEWRERTAGHALGHSSVQFVAERGDSFIGSLVVFVRAAGVPDYFDRIPELDLPTVVGVYVAPSGRGLGVIDALLAAAAEWSRERGDHVLTLDVHESNTPAIRSYERSGFEVRSEFVAESGRELGMVKSLDEH
jgi:ribosomal protein S18 acetylase RimI-like enzyme